MVAIGISEFSFGYAFLHEQTENYLNNLRAAPILPSLVEEAEYGWDARLPLQGTDYYYQFKLSDYLSRSNASFIRDGTYEGPYYRVSLHRNNFNRQHQRLKELSRDNPNTFYVAPEFNNLDQFNSAFLTQNITSQSRLIPLSECEQINDNDQHYITYQQNSENWIFHSQKKFSNKSYFGKNLFTLYKEAQPIWKPINENYIAGLFDKTVKNAFKVMDKEERAYDKTMNFFEFDPQQSTSSQILNKTSQILSIFYGVILVLVGI